MKKLFTIDQRQIYDMSYAEIIGCIFIRSQAIEQMMRQLLESHHDYRLPNNFDRMTFGQLLADLRTVYPAIEVPKHPDFPDLSLYSWLENTRDIRNDAAHGYYLIGLSVAQALDNYGTKADIGRFNLRTLQKSLQAVDQCAFEFFNYTEENKLRIDVTQKPGEYTHRPSGHKS